MKLIVNNDCSIFCNADSSYYPEDYVKVIMDKQNGDYNVIEVHRADESIILNCKDYDLATVYALILYKRLNDDITDRNEIRRIRSLLESGNEHTVQNELKELYKNTLVINEEKKDKISLLLHDSFADLRYDEKIIAENVSTQRGYIMACNYSAKLEYIKKFCDNLESSVGKIFDTATAYNVYLFGR